MDRELGYSAIWLSRPEPRLLQRAGRSPAQPTSDGIEAGDLPSGTRMFSGCGRSWTLRRHDDGIYTARGIDDGNAKRIDRSGHRDVRATAPGSYG